MNDNAPLKHTTGSLEFIILMAILMSLGAFAIDSIFPAISVISQELGVTGKNDGQLLITTLFIGFSVGQLFFGPFSDRYGRKPGIYIGISILTIGTVLSIFSTTFEMMLFGRLLQGIGTSSTRTITIAIIRDRYESSEMAKVISLIMTIFILIPVIAPTIGQVILNISSWHWIFAFLLLIGLSSLLWYALRQDETLKPEFRRTLAFKEIISTSKEIFTHKQTSVYMVAAGLIFGAFLGYLISSPQIFEDCYNRKEDFPFYFGLLASSIGFASFTNSRLVTVFGMRRLITVSLFALLILSLTFLSIVLFITSTPPFYLFVTFMFVIFFPVGILFGNLNSLSMEPMGHIAGIASTLTGTVQSLVSLTLGSLIGALYEGTIVPLITGFTILSFVTFLIVLWENRSIKN